MKMIAGSIVVLAAAILAASVVLRSGFANANDNHMVVAESASFMLGIVGLVLILLGFFDERKY